MNCCNVRSSVILYIITYVCLDMYDKNNYICALIILNLNSLRNCNTIYHRSKMNGTNQVPGFLVLCPLPGPF